MRNWMHARMSGARRGKHFGGVAMVAAAAVVATMFSAPAMASENLPSEVSRTTNTAPAQTEGTDAPQVEMTGSGPGYFTLAATSGTFELESGVVSIVDARGNKTLLRANGIAESGASTPVNYSLSGQSLTVRWDPTAGVSDVVSAKSGGLTWGCILSYLGMGLGTIGIIVATGGTATVFLLGGASYVVSVASVLDSCY